MAAGQGFKTFTTGEVLTAGDVNGYLMQGILVFANSTARDAAITSPQEGQFAYLKDTNVTTYYTGSAWANADTTGMTNPMTTTGDTIYSSSGSTPARLGIGSTGNVLTVSGGVPVWAAPASAGGMTLLSTTSLSGATTVISGISGSYNSLFIVGYGVTNATADGTTRIAPNGATGDSYYTLAQGAATPQNRIANYIFVLGNSSQTITRTNANNVFTFRIDNYASASNYKSFQLYSGAAGSGGQEAWQIGGGAIFSNTAITSLTFSNSGGNLSTGTVLVYGVK